MVSSWACKQVMLEKNRIQRRRRVSLFMFAKEPLLRYGYVNWWLIRAPTANFTVVVKLGGGTMRLGYIFSMLFYRLQKCTLKNSPRRNHHFIFRNVITIAFLHFRLHYVMRQIKIAQFF
jgi:hypothetical protein